MSISSFCPVGKFHLKTTRRAEEEAQARDDEQKLSLRAVLEPISLSSGVNPNPIAVDAMPVVWLNNRELRPL